MKLTFKLTFFSIFAFLLTACNSTKSLQQSLSNNQGILAIPVHYIPRPDSGSGFSNSQVEFNIQEINWDKKESERFSKTAQMVVNEGMTHFLIAGLNPGKYKVISYSRISHAQTGVQSDWSVSRERRANIRFEISASEFTVLNQQFQYEEIDETDEAYNKRKRLDDDFDGSRYIFTKTRFLPLMPEQLKSLQAEMQVKKQQLTTSSL